MPIFTFVKLVDAGALHKLLVTNGFLVTGITYDSGTNTAKVILEESETKDPTSIVTDYVYIEPVIPNYPQLYTDAKATVTSALAQYNTAVSNYQTALSAWNIATTTTTKFTAVESQITACASAISACKDAISALVNVVSVLAKERSIED